eukprot:TRINITY_DN178_c0_g1_i1.p1 TRINITY_DN178_c0_g1~~TRINITY_DN178_c0_g1_i1.p1  ORF type:complete len:563 (+),score=82.36 TRINITY_DN178_c0_g1_i1:484-2172(+)
MVGGPINTRREGGRNINDGKMTHYVLLVSLVAASGGLMFGYDVGISGGVTTQKSFLRKFFPTVLRKTEEGNADSSSYCKYDNQLLQLFTSSLYIAGLVATYAASYTTNKWGRRPTMQIAGLSYLLGTALTSGSQEIIMLIVGRIFLGIGVGFANQAVPLYLSEMAPPRLRGGLNILFQLFITIGIFVANLTNYGTGKIHGWGWRLSFAGAGVPAFILGLGGLLLPDTPNSLIQRGKVDEGRKVLTRVRGTDDVGEEMIELVEASDAAKLIKNPWKNIVQRRNRPQLVITILFQFFQQMTGINAIMFYAPPLFETLGFKNDASLYSAIITGGVNVLATLVGVFSVDRLGRRKLLLESGFQMFFSMIVIAILLGTGIKEGKDLPMGTGIIVIVLLCVFVSGFAWSWGPLGWLVPSEIFPLETRSAGQSITVCFNLLFTATIAQAFLSMLCAMKYGIFLFFAGWIVIMTVFVYFFVPETKGVPIEEMKFVWRRHWFWKKVVPQGDDYNDVPLPMLNGSGKAKNGEAENEGIKSPLREGKDGLKSHHKVEEDKARDPDQYSHLTGR